jgi:hypothetical protein
MPHRRKGGFASLRNGDSLLMVLAVGNRAVASGDRHAKIRPHSTRDENFYGNARGVCLIASTFANFERSFSCPPLFRGRPPLALIADERH